MCVCRTEQRVLTKKPCMFPTMHNSVLCVYRACISIIGTIQYPHACKAALRPHLWPEFFPVCVHTYATCSTHTHQYSHKGGYRGFFFHLCVLQVTDPLARKIRICDLSSSFSRASLASPAHLEAFAQVRRETEEEATGELFLPFISTQRRSWA